jgi:hypothetical protein
MKKLITMTVVVLLLAGWSVALAASVPPIPSENKVYGDAAHICVTSLDYDFGIKIEAWGGPGGDRDMTGTYKGAYDGQGKFDADFDNTITITKATRYLFSWKSDPYAIGAVVVQGGWMDNIFYYDQAVYSDEGLYPYDSGTNKKETISHISFCWNKTDGGGGEECYQDETAWAEGDQYGPNWAMYVPYESEEITVDVYVSQNLLAGTATFSAPADGEVTITINLNEGFIFYFDLADDEEDNNLKVQDYAEAPIGVNPAPGQFIHKTFIPVGSDTGSIVVPVNNYYGVHMDLAYLVDCED